MQKRILLSYHNVLLRTTRLVVSFTKEFPRKSSSDPSHARAHQQSYSLPTTTEDLNRQYLRSNIYEKESRDPEAARYRSWVIVVGNKLVPSTLLKR